MGKTFWFVSYVIIGFFVSSAWDSTIDCPIWAISFAVSWTFLAAFTPILEYSLALLLACWSDVLISPAFANTVLLTSRVAVT